jgi:hypothetical protein
MPACTFQMARNEAGDFFLHLSPQIPNVIKLIRLTGFHPLPRSREGRPAQRRRGESNRRALAPMQLREHRAQIYPPGRRFAGPALPLLRTRRAKKLNLITLRRIC